MANGNIGHTLVTQHRWVLRVLGLAMGAALLAACGSQASPAGKPSTEPTRSAIASSGAERFRAEPVAALCNRSRTTSDLEILRRRDSPSISATSRSGTRIVSVFIRLLYYMTASSARQAKDGGEMCRAPGALHPSGCPAFRFRWLRKFPVQP